MCPLTLKNVTNVIIHIFFSFFLTRDQGFDFRNVLSSLLFNCLLSVALKFSAMAKACFPI